MFPIKKFDDVIKEMKSFGAFLMPYNRPKATQADEEAINIMKAREITIDGYNVVIYYSKSDWPNFFIDTVQVTGRYIPFLPFSLVCKIGKKFLGEKHLSYVDYMENNRKNYCWTLATDKFNNPVPAPYKEEILSNDCEYQGLCYKCLIPL